jgi:glycosyltransferase involved in cell wall biosynthesis
VRILVCVQRYGDDVAGGSEAAARAVAQRLAVRGHTVEVVTSRARSYADWADHYAAGTSVEHGVTVHRLSVRAPRNERVFAAIHGRVLARPDAPTFVQRDWLRLQGPDLPELVPWLRANVARFDVALFFTYLYPTTALGLPVASERCPTVLVPTAHEEPMFEFRVFDPLFRAADALVFLTPEERQLVAERFRFEPVGDVVGLGIDPPSATADPGRFRDRYGLGDRPYVTFVGRIDPGKGTDELHRYFVEARRRGTIDASLVVIGDPVTELPPHPDIVMTGFVDEQTKHDALAGTSVLVQPSYFESFSLALCEGWAAGVPALVQGRCAVLAGQSARSGGGIAYHGYAEFAEGLRRLLADNGLRQQMGEHGRQYVERHYRWETVISGYEAVLARVAADSSWRLPRPAAR